MRLQITSKTELNQNVIKFINIRLLGTYNYKLRLLQLY